MSEQNENPVSLEEEAEAAAPESFDLAALIPAAMAGGAAIQAALEEIAATNELIARATLARSFVFRDSSGKFQFDAAKFEKCFSLVSASMETGENPLETPESQG